jgi:CO dehydrogenase maturation factor
VKTLIAVGRGGTGKSSLIALIAKYLIEQQLSPLLLVDVDPDQNLGEMVGVDLADYQKMTISELLIETFIDSGGTTVGIPPSERIEGKLWEKGLFEGEHFDLLSVGPKWIEGCYCLPDAALKNALKRLTKNYQFVLIDSPAGLEHLNRRITSQVDDLFDIIDPSHKAIVSRKKSRSPLIISMLSEEIDFQKNLKIVLNHELASPILVRLPMIH